MLQAKITRRAWKQINFRSTKTLLAAEFLHGLYQRHDPFLNPIRFCNTIVYFRQWRSLSYAPTTEWDLLGLRFGGRILRQFQKVKPELDRVLSNPRQRSLDLIQELAQTDLQSLNDLDLGDMLMASHHIPLGEIYDVNMVQVEHALHFAIDVRLQQLGYNKIARQETISKLCWTKECSSSSSEENNFLHFILECQENSIFDPNVVLPRLIDFVGRYQTLGAAYGASTVNLEGLKHRFTELFQLDRQVIIKILNRHLVSPEIDEKILNDQLVSELVLYFKRAGIVRDNNKKLLGKISQYRDSFLMEIARRRSVSTDTLRLYLLEELMQLLEYGINVPSSVLQIRYNEGVVFSRSEHVDRPNAEVAITLDEQIINVSSKTLLRGLCASCGQYQGKVRIIQNASDLTKVQFGDVVVAQGTDFDLAPLLQMAGGIITEEGGMLSHAAVLAREFNIPCIIQVPNATKLLHDDIMVNIDANEGVIRLIQSDTINHDVLISPTKPFENMILILDRPIGKDIIGQKAATLLLLQEHKMPVPENMTAISIYHCSQIAKQIAIGKSSLLNEITLQIISHYNKFSTTRLSIRSSSLGEDLATGSAAGIYESVIDVINDYTYVYSALKKVILSASASSAQMYHQKNFTELYGIAVLVTPYMQFDLQGRALSESLYKNDNVLIEVFESTGRYGGELSGGYLLEFPIKSLPKHNAQDEIKNIYLEKLQNIAQFSLICQEFMGSTIEIEWGMSSQSIILLQARPIVSKFDFKH